MQRDRLADNVLDLLCTTFDQYLRDAELVPDPRQRLLMQVLRYVEDNLHDPGVSPAGIAASLHISTRYLHKLFEAEGTTACAWIRARRLENCRRDLADPALSGRPVSAVGAVGGARPSRFSRLFREAYQVSPREYRLQHGGGAPLRWRFLIGSPATDVVVRPTLCPDRQDRAPRRLVPWGTPARTDRRCGSQRIFP